MRTVLAALFFWSFLLTPLVSAQGGPYLGVTLEQADRGLLITEVVPASPAAKAGLKPRDIIVRVNNKQVAALDPFIDGILAKKPGYRLDLRIRRNGRQHDLSVVLGTRGKVAAAKPKAAREGRGKTAARGKQAAKPRGKGVLGVELVQAGDRITIENVVKGGAAERGGLRAGDRILGAGGKEVSDIDQLVASIQKAGAGSRYPLHIRRGNRDLKLVVRLGGRGAAKGKPSAIVAKKQKPARPKARGKANKWSTQFAKAQALASKQGKPLVIDFYADWCRPCAMLEKSFASPAVKSILADCVLVRVDVDKSEKLADSYGVSSIPHVVVLDPSKKELGKFTGYLPAEALAKKLGGYLEGVKTGRAVAQPKRPDRAKRPDRPRRPNRNNRAKRPNRPNRAANNAANRLRRLLAENERKMELIKEIQRLEAERGRINRRIAELLQQLGGQKK